MHNKGRILIGTCGAPGASTLIRYAKMYKSIETIAGYDADHEAVGRFMVDKFLKVPKVTVEPQQFIELLLAFVEENGINIVCVCSSLEVEVLAEEKGRFEELGCNVLVSDLATINQVNNKRILYQRCKEYNLCPTPDFRWFSDSAGFHEALEELSVKHDKLCLKPSNSKGKRGFRRIVSGRQSAVDAFFNEKPSNETITIAEISEIFTSIERFPEMLLMEEVSGADVDTMALSDGTGKFVGATHKTRERDRGGVIDRGELFNSAKLDEQTRSICEHFGTYHLIGVQYKGDYIIEINPRFSSFIYSDHWNDIWVLFDLILGHVTFDGAVNLYNEKPEKIRMVRYFDQVFYCQSTILEK